MGCGVDSVARCECLDGYEGGGAERPLGVVGEEEGCHYWGEAECETHNGFGITLCFMWCSNEVFKLMVM